MHKLLERQLRRVFGAERDVSPECRALLTLIDEAYASFDADRALAERSMVIASQELTEQNAMLLDAKQVSDALYQIGRTIAAELDLSSLMQSVTAEAARATHATCGGFFGEAVTRSGAPQRLVAMTGKPPPAAVDQLQATAAEVFGAVGGPRTLRQATAGPSLPLQSVLASPVRSRRGEYLGSLIFGHTQPSHFTDRDERLLQGIASHTAIAIHNARLYQAAQDANEQLLRQATYDSLTGLPNRVLFHDRVERCLERARRTPGHFFAVMFIDLDRFKVVNDSLGHAVGDQLLVMVSERLRQCLRATDSVARDPAVTVARLGGDEFTVLLDSVRTPEDTALVAKRLIDCLTEPMQIGPNEVQVGASIGIAVGSPQYESAEALLRDADAAMYSAKTSGRSRFVIFDANIHHSFLNRAKLEAALRHAVSRGELRLYYQPIICLSTRQIVGFEALARWHHNQRIICPGEFVPLAEETGIIHEIGRWVTAEACRQLKVWQSRHPHLAELTVSINLSRKQLMNPGIVDEVVDIAREHEVEPRHLKLEITESMVMYDLDTSIGKLNRFKSLGFSVQMDDFGSGYSSLGHLNRFPLDGLKIDRSFIANVAGRRDCAAVLQAIITMAHNLDARVIAEGLEEPEQVVLLQVLDCDYGQGFFFSQPLTPEAAETFALSHSTTVAAAAA